MKRHLTLLGFLLTLLLQAQTQIPMGLPAQSGTFTGNVRGYYFTAPTCFTITGLEVPTDAGTGNQSIAVVRLNALPPLYSTTTNSFTTLFLVQNGSPTGIFPVNIQVEQGDIIGILGQRATVNSYGAGNYLTNIDGFPVTISRLGMQFPLTTTPPQQLWTEASGSISRVTMYYDSLITYNITATPTLPGTYQFSDGSDSSFTSVWDYGDGSPLDATWNPTHTYSTSGTYNVCSYITNSCGTDTLCTTVTVCLGNPVASFTTSGTSATISFTDGTTNLPTSWAWDFGDGSPVDNTQNPSHTYSTSGTYNVCLIATNGCNISDTICQAVMVCVPPAAAFTASTNGGSVSFSNSSTQGITWAWDFGDGSPVDTNASPTHVYTTNGTYNVCLVAIGSCATDTICSTVTICLPVTAAYTSVDNAGTVSFTDGSTNATSWAWDFGDNSPIDNNQNPTHTYTANGTYNVCLIATSSCTADTICTTVTICLPVTAGYTQTASGDTVWFNNTSSNSTSWIWDFGDGSPLDTTQHPVHVYSTNGTYTVCVTAMSNCDSATSCVSITVCMPATAGFTSGTPSGGTVSFIDQSTNTTGWSWDFGDGSPIDNSPSPSHTYTTNGTYQVCLITTNMCSADTVCHDVTVCPQAVVATFSPSGNQQNYTFTNTSANAIGYFWQFGDNTTSTAMSPTHTYAGTGLHIVCLSAYNACGDTVTTCDSIIVQVIGIAQNEAVSSIGLYPNPFSEQATLLVQSSTLSGNFDFELTDLTGKVVSVQTGQLNKEMQIGRSSLASGVYFYQVRKEGMMLGSGKLVVR